MVCAAKRLGVQPNCDEKLKPRTTPTVPLMKQNLEHKVNCYVKWERAERHSVTYNPMKSNFDMKSAQDSPFARRRGTPLSEKRRRQEATAAIGRLMKTAIDGQSLTVAGERVRKKDSQPHQCVHIPLAVNGYRGTDPAICPRPSQRWQA